MDDTEDLPLRYSFNTKDLCTGWVRKLPPPVGNDNNIDVMLLHDLEGLCELENRRVEIFGTVSDRYGSSAELCDIASECPIAALEPMIDVEPAEMIGDVQTLIKDNKMTSLEALDQISVAVKIRQSQEKQSEQDKTATQQKDVIDEKVEVLSILKVAASEALEEDTLQTSRLQGQIMDVIASTITNEDVTEEPALGIADKALEVAGAVVGRVSALDDVEKRNELVTSAVAVFGGVSKFLSPSRKKSLTELRKQQKALRKKLKARADEFCSSITADTQPGDATMGSASQDFVFNCQKAMVQPDEEVDGFKTRSRVALGAFKSIGITSDEQQGSPPLDIVINQLHVPNFRAIHLQAPSTSLAPDSDSGLHTHRRLTDSCEAAPSSELRLVTDGSFESGTVLLVRQRTETSLHACRCSECSARNTMGGLFLPSGASPGLVLQYIKLARGEVLQKFYLAAVGADTAFTAETSYVDSESPGSMTTTPRSKFIAERSLSSTGQVASIVIVEGPLDNFLQVNSLLHLADNRNLFRMSLTCWAVVLTIAGLVIVFSGFMAHALWYESRPPVLKRRQAQMQHMFLSFGYINSYTLPASVANRASCGTIRCLKACFRCAL